MDLQEYKRQWYLKNKERCDKKNRENYIKNREIYLERSKQWRINNREKRRIHNRLYKKRHPEKIKEQKAKYGQRHLKERGEYSKVYRATHREKCRATNTAYFRRLRKNSVQFRIASRLRISLWHAMKQYGNGKKCKSTYYGVNFQKIIEHLGTMPTDGRKYHIDHIRPLCSFDLTQLSEIKVAFSPENHQWLEASENIRKGGRCV